jgi:hypothetical protein
MRKLFVLAVGVLAASMAVPSNAAVKSGLAEGESPGAFHVLDVTGPSKGKKLCYRCQFGAKPVVSIFARNVDKELISLLKKTDDFVAKNEDEKASAFFVLLTDDPDAAEIKLKELAKKHKIKVPLTIFDGKAGPKGYKLAKDADVTVLMWSGSTVKANYAYKKGELNKSEVAKIAKSTSKILD